MAQAVFPFGFAVARRRGSQWLAATMTDSRDHRAGPRNGLRSTVGPSVNERVNHPRRLDRPGPGQELMQGIQGDFQCCIMPLVSAKATAKRAAGLAGQLTKRSAVAVLAHIGPLEIQAAGC